MVKSREHNGPSFDPAGCVNGSGHETEFRDSRSSVSPQSPDQHRNGLERS